MADGTVGLASLSDDLTAEQKAAIEAAMNDIASRSFHPFTGPILDQDGAEKLAAGVTIEDGALLGINWLVKGVETRIPK